MFEDQMRNDMSKFQPAEQKPKAYEVYLSTLNRMEYWNGTPPVTTCEQEEWLEEQSEAGSLSGAYAVFYDYYPTLFKFESEHDAVMFKLRWAQ